MVLIVLVVFLTDRGVYQNTPASLLGGSPIDIVYLLANNHRANSTWELIQIQTGDLLFMFNDAYPLTYFTKIPKEQMIWILRAENETWFNGQDMIPELIGYFETLVFLGGSLESNPHITEDSFSTQTGRLLLEGGPLWPGQPGPPSPPGACSVLEGCAQR